MTNRYLFLFIFFFTQQLGTAQFVWSGDVNNNGVVNKVDLLYLGYAFGETGEPRTTISSEWGAQASPIAWEGSFPNGVNYLYADCNGDGIINELDAAIIAQNIGLSHVDVLFVVDDEILIGKEGENPACRFMNAPAAAPVNQLFTIEIGLGDANIPIENMSGFTFILDVEPDIIGLNNTTLTFSENAWIDPDPNQSITIQQIDEERAKLKVAYTKTDRVPVSGFGNLAKVSFLIEGDIVDFLVRDTVTYTIDSIIVFTDDLTPIPIVPDTLKLAIDKNLTVNTLEQELSQNISVYPNPNKGFLLIESNEIIIEKITLVNGLGQQVFSKKLEKQSFQSIDFQHLAKGIYYVKIHTEKGIKTDIIHKF